MAVELNSQEVPYAQQHSFDVMYKGVNVGKYIPDFIIADQIVTEIKTVDRITDAEKGQVLNYLKVTGLRVGLILNFKNPRLEWQRMVL